MSSGITGRALDLPRPTPPCAAPRWWTLGGVCGLQLSASDLPEWSMPFSCTLVLACPSSALINADLWT